MSAITALLAAPPNNFSTTLSAGIGSTDLTIPLNSVSGLGTEGVGVLYAKDTSGNPTASSIEFIHWTNTSGNNLTLTDTGDRGISGSASGAQAHSAGDTFEVWTHSSYYPRSALLAVLTSAGILDTTKVVDLTTAQTLTNKSLTTPKIASLYQDSIGGSNLLTMPAATDTLVGKATTDTLTNKTIDDDNNILQNIAYAAIKGVAWTSYNPTLGGLTLGNGSKNFAYLQIGKMVIVRGTIIWGSTTSASASLTFTLPVTAVGANGEQSTGVRLLDSGTALYFGVVDLTNTTTCTIKVLQANLTYVVSTDVNATTPHTWAVNDQVNFYMMYEAA